MLATTLHTFATDGKPNNRNCDRWGCQAQTKLPQSGKFHIRSDFGHDGRCFFLTARLRKLPNPNLDWSVTVFLDGVPNSGYSPVPSGSSNQVVVKTMSTIGLTPSPLTLARGDLTPAFIG